LNSIEKQKILSLFVSDTQLMGLEKRFETQKYLSTPDRIEFANLLNLTQSQVKTWYQNRRMKWKKQVCIYIHILFL